MKIALVMRGATLFSLAIPQFKNPKLSNFANKPEKHPKKGKLVQIAQKIHLTMRKNGAPPRKIGNFLQNLSNDHLQRLCLHTKFLQISPNDA